MAKKTFLEVFGASASQTDTVLTVSKFRMSEFGLTRSATNTPQSILVALIKRFCTILTEDNRLNNLDETMVIKEESRTITNQSGTDYQKITYRVDIYSQIPLSSIDPDNY